MGSWYPTTKAKGKKSKKAINNPLNTPLIFKVDADMRNPTIIQWEKAEKLALQGNFWNIIGITSTIPAITPQKRPL